MSTIERATRKDWLWPGVFLVLGVLGVLVARQFFFQAFPEASIDLKLSRNEITQRSEQFLRGRGLDAGAFRHVTVFDFDDQAKTYLERELGLEEANRAMASRVNIWRWRTRWVKPPEKEEFSVWLTTRGELTGFDHQVAEAAEGASLSKEEAQRIAEVFLRAERKVDLSRFDLVTDDVKERPKRLDYTFTWQERDFRLKEARLRMSVTVLGDQVGGFREFLKVPEQWVRDYELLRSRNALYQTIATVLYVLLFVTAIVMIFRNAKRLSSPWPALLGIGLVAGLLYMADFWNQFGLNTRVMPTNVTFEVWTVLYFIGMLLLGLMVMFYVLVLAASGEPLYRELQPDKVALGHLFTFPGLRSKEFFTSTLVGYGMAGMHIGLVVLFYDLARRMGAWAPLDVNYNNAISTAMPWLPALSTSVFAATTEEFAFRLFAIPLLLRWTKSKWIAVLLPAFAWGFLHSAYPQQPAWIRGVEVGLIGVVAGWVFLRFGILATLVWHYTVDAVLIGMFLLRSDHLTYRMAGALVGDLVLLPLVIAGVFYLQSRGFLKDERILNRAPVEVEEEDELPEPAAAILTPAGAGAAGVVGRFAFLSRGALLRLALAGVAGLVALIAIDVPRAGDQVTLQVGPKRAESIAVDHLQKLGHSIDRYRHVTWLEDDIRGSDADYLVGHAGTRQAASLYHDQVPAVFWRTRFFRSLEKEEFSVYVTPDGKVARIAHQLDEKAPGAQLEKPEALARAQSFLADNPERTRVSLADYRLVEHNLEKRDARNDHTLVWETTRQLVADATHRITVAVKGDEAAGPRHWIKIPEDWERRHTRPSLFTLMPVILMVALGLVGIALFARAVPRTRVRWRAHIWVGLVGALLQSLTVANAAPSLLQGVDTSVPWSTNVLIFALGGLMAAMFSGAAITMLSAAVETLLAERFGPITLWPSTAPERGRAVLQGLAAGVCGALLLAGVRMVVDLGIESIPSATRGVKSGLPGFDAHLSPGFGMVTSTLYGALWQSLLLGAVAGVLLRLFRDQRVLIVALVAGTALMASSALDAPHYFKTWVALLAMLAVMGWLVRTLRFNAAAYVVLFFVVSGLGRLGVQFRHPGLASHAVWAGVALVALLVIAALWGRMQARRDGEQASMAAAALP